MRTSADSVSSCVAVRHWTVVLDDHAEVLHIATSCIPDIVKSRDPKLRPVTVTEAMPELGEFVKPYDTAGASKESSNTPVPATAPTVNWSTVIVCCCGALWHWTEVALDHALVAQCTPPNLTESEYSIADPKLRPLTVTLDPPLNAVFSVPYERAAPSKLNWR